MQAALARCVARQTRPCSRHPSAGSSCHCHSTQSNILLTHQIAVLKEMDGRGPFSALVMGVVVFKDVLVILAFSLNLQMVPALLGTAAAGAWRVVVCRS